MGIKMHNSAEVENFITWESSRASITVVGGSLGNGMVPRNQPTNEWHCSLRRRYKDIPAPRPVRRSPDWHSECIMNE